MELATRLSNAGFCQRIGALWCTVTSKKLEFIYFQVLFTCFPANSITLTDLGHFLNIQQNYLNKYLLTTGTDRGQYPERILTVSQDVSQHLLSCLGEPNVKPLRYQCSDA